MAVTDPYRIAPLPEASEPSPYLPAETLGNLDIDRIMYLLSYLSPEGPPYADPSAAGPKPMGSGGIPWGLGGKFFAEREAKKVSLWEER